MLKEGDEWGRLQGQRATKRRKWRKGYAEETEEMLRDSWNTAVGTGKEVEGLGEGKTQWLQQRGVCPLTPGITETAEEVFRGTNSRDCPTEQCRAQHELLLLTEASQRYFSRSVLWSTDGFKGVMIVA